MFAISQMATVNALRLDPALAQTWGLPRFAADFMAAKSTTLGMYYLYVILNSVIRGNWPASTKHIDAVLYTCSLLMLDGSAQHMRTTST